MTAYSEATLAGVLDDLRQAEEGQRNATLNRAAFRLGQLVAAGELDRSEAEQELLSAAQAAGLDKSEALPTIKSGLRAGSRSPHTSEPPRTRPSGPPPKPRPARGEGPIAFRGTRWPRHDRPWLGEPFELSIDGLREALASPIEIDDKDKLPQWSLCVFADGYRRNKSFKHANGVMLDADAPTIGLEQATDLFAREGIAVAGYTSWSHTAGSPHWRLLLPCSRQINAEEYRALEAWAGRLLEGLDKVGPAGGLYVPAQRDGYSWVCCDGNPLDVDRLLEKPSILVSTDMAETIDSAQAALLKLGGIYQRAGSLVRITTEASPPKLLSRPAGTPTIDMLPIEALTEELSSAAHWLVVDGRSKTGVRPSRPPAWVAATLAARGSWPFPVLEAVVQAPTLRPDGSLLERPGYDSDSGLLLLPSRETWPEVPKRPGRDAAVAAIEALGEVLADFPWQADCDRAAALALMLSLAGRFAVNGPVPIFAVRAPTAGSGKTLLADVCCTVGIGRGPARMAQAIDSDEERKRLTAIALAGDRAVVVDNVARPFGTAALDMAVTSGEVRDRVLGQQRMISAPWQAVLAATGNNLCFAGDTGRRTIPVDLDPQVERPEEREGFKHPDLLAWVTRERPRLLAAALTTLRAFFEAGCPRQGLTALGSFEAWSGTVREALVWAGQPDPCEGRSRIRDDGDPARSALGEALGAWYGRWESRPLTVADVIRGSSEHEQLRDALGGLCLRYDGRLNSRSLGAGLRRHVGRIVDGLRFARAGRSGHAAVWRVEHVGRSRVTGVERVVPIPTRETVSDSLYIGGSTNSRDSRNSHGTDPELPLGDSGSDMRARIDRLRERCGDNAKAQEALDLAARASNTFWQENHLSRAERLLDGGAS
ncbi:MAG: hypothetical protein JXR96_27010 [Deltaproteobacteria bacterium]|nr:hypothetical protein [Deltaproteobacteria bacterium]